MAIMHCPKYLPSLPLRGTAGCPSLFAFVLVLATSLAILPAPDARATTFTVNSTVDAVDANPGDGVCETGPGNGVCTLRAAIQETNALSGADTIDLPKGVYDLTIPGTHEDAAASGDLDISEELVVTGSIAKGTPVSIVDGNSLDRVFDVLPGIWLGVTLSGVTVRNGRAVTAEDHFPGGLPVIAGGGIRYASDLTVEHAVIRDNLATANGQLIHVRGGGLANMTENDPTLILTDVVVHGNDADNEAFMDYTSMGGGVFSLSGTVIIENCRISANGNACGDKLSCEAGGITVYNADQLLITDSTISDNGGHFEPGSGVHVKNSATISISGTTINNNSEMGIIVFGSPNSSTFTMTNSTISGNGYTEIVLNANATLRNVTVAYNGYYGLRSGTTLTLANTIIANNGLVYNPQVSFSDCDGQFTSMGYNIDSDGTCGLNQQTDLPGTDPKLGALVWNNGAEIHPLLPGSPAIDAGSPATPRNRWQCL